MIEKEIGEVEWFLEGYLDTRKTLRRWLIRPLPFRVGRRTDMHLCLPFKSVSGQHAEFFTEKDSLRLRDLDSLNGTFINRKKLHGEASVEEGDVLHFSEYEFRVGRTEAQRSGDTSSHTMYTELSDAKLPQQMAVGVREFKQMLLQHAVVPMFQPIVEIKGGKRVGFEILGRGGQEGLASAPLELFRIAASLGLEAELSTLFRLRGVEEAQQLKGKPKIFVNTHPAEMESPRLVASLKALYSESQPFSLILEIHEAAVTGLAHMQELRNELRQLDIGLAYDDFGAGQARLLELVEVPPDYLKFDVALIHKIDEAPESKQKMVASLVKVAEEIGVICLAEGVETEKELSVCGQMDFQLAQGFLFGRPAPLSEWL